MSTTLLRFKDLAGAQQEVRFSTVAEARDFGEDLERAGTAVVLAVETEEGPMARYQNISPAEESQRLRAQDAAAEHAFLVAEETKMSFSHPGWTNRHPLAVPDREVRCGWPDTAGCGWSGSLLALFDQPDLGQIPCPRCGLELPV